MDSKSCCNTDNNDTKPKIAKTKSQTIKTIHLNHSDSTEQGTCCCSGDVIPSTEPITQFNKNNHWIIGEINTDVGTIPQVSTKLVLSDTLGAWKVRWGIGRMNYKINPGIYAIGTPDNNSNVLVTANYKLTLDFLRKELTGLNLWILVPDTKGVNVWCAAGKGTFGTKEIINRIGKTRLSEIVSHRNLILPQLGAPGVSAHEITKNTGFHVIYGPVRAADIKAFINSEFHATPKMREVRFTAKDRLVLTPMEVTNSIKPSLITFGIMFLINLIAVNKFGLIDFYAYIGALLTGCVITPILLPFIPVKPFALKGWLLGLLWTIFVVCINGWPYSTAFGVLRGAAYLLILPSVSAFFAMNFTGSSTYTSFSGVMKEMKKALPIIITTIVIGIALLLVNCFIKL